MSYSSRSRWDERSRQPSYRSRDREEDKGSRRDVYRSRKSRSPERSPPEPPTELRTDRRSSMSAFNPPSHVNTPRPSAPPLQRAQTSTDILGRSENASGSPAAERDPRKLARMDTGLKSSNKSTLQSGAGVGPSPQAPVACGSPRPSVPTTASPLPQDPTQSAGSVSLESETLVHLLSGLLQNTTALALAEIERASSASEVEKTSRDVDRWKSKGIKEFFPFIETTQNAKNRAISRNHENEKKVAEAKGAQVEALHRVVKQLTRPKESADPERLRLTQESRDKDTERIRALEECKKEIVEKHRSVEETMTEMKSSLTQTNKQLSLIVDQANAHSLSSRLSTVEELSHRLIRTSESQKMGFKNEVQTEIKSAMSEFEGRLNSADNPRNSQVHRLDGQMEAHSQQLRAIQRQQAADQETIHSQRQLIESMGLELKKLQQGNAYNCAEISRLCSEQRSAVKRDERVSVLERSSQQERDRFEERLSRLRTENAGVVEKVNALESIKDVVEGLQTKFSEGHNEQEPLPRDTEQPRSQSHTDGLEQPLTDLRTDLEDLGTVVRQLGGDIAAESKNRKVAFEALRSSVNADLTQVRTSVQEIDDKAQQLSLTLNKQISTFSNRGGNIRPSSHPSSAPLMPQMQQPQGSPRANEATSVTTPEPPKGLPQFEQKLDQHVKLIAALQNAIEAIEERYNKLTTEPLVRAMVGQMQELYPYASSMQHEVTKINDVLNFVQTTRLPEITGRISKLESTDTPHSIELVALVQALDESAKKRDSALNQISQRLDHLDREMQRLSGEAERLNGQVAHQQEDNAAKREQLLKDVKAERDNVDRKIEELSSGATALSNKLQEDRTEISDAIITANKRMKETLDKVKETCRTRHDAMTRVPNGHKANGLIIVNRSDRRSSSSVPLAPSNNPARNVGSHSALLNHDDGLDSDPDDSGGEIPATAAPRSKPSTPSSLKSTLLVNKRKRSTPTSTASRQGSGPPSARKRKKNVQNDEDEDYRPESPDENQRPRGRLRRLQSS